MKLTKKTIMDILISHVEIVLELLMYMIYYNILFNTLGRIKYMLGNIS